MIEIFSIDCTILRVKPYRCDPLTVQKAKSFKGTKSIFLHIRLNKTKNWIFCENLQDLLILTVV